MVHEQVLHGDIFSCVDGNWKDGEGKDIPLDKPFICLGAAEVVQRFEDGKPVKDDVYIRTTTKPLPDIDNLNPKIPQARGNRHDDKPRPPWSRSYSGLSARSGGRIDPHVH